MRVAFVPRSAEIQPSIWRFVTFIPHLLSVLAARDRRARVQASPSLVVFIDAIEISIYVSISDEKRKKSPACKRGVENTARGCEERGQTLVCEHTRNKMPEVQTLWRPPCGNAPIAWPRPAPAFSLSSDDRPNARSTSAERTVQHLPNDSPCIDESESRKNHHSGGRVVADSSGGVDREKRVRFRARERADRSRGQMRCVLCTATRRRTNSRSHTSPRASGGNTSHCQHLHILCKKVNFCV